MRKKPELLKLAEIQRAELLEAIEQLNNRQLVGWYVLKQCGFAYRIDWQTPDAAPIPIMEWTSFNNIKEWIQKEKRCLQ